MNQQFPLRTSKFSKSYEIFDHAKRIIPGGTTKSRSPQSFLADNYPVYAEKGLGCHLWDVDGNEYIDWVMSLGPPILGYSHPDVNNAVIRELRSGTNLTLTKEIQNRLAEKLIEIIPCAEMALFFKTGSDATAASIRIARIHTGKEKVVRWGFHGWHDWCCPEEAGIPKGVRANVLTFEYNDLNSLEKTLEENRNNVACIIMMPFEVIHPNRGFLEGVKELATSHGSVLIFDEIRTGFRMGLGGAQEYFNITPDLTTISKGMANGFPISAVVGKADIMRCAERSFFSASFFLESVSMAAALATIRILEKKDSIKHIWKIGEGLIDGLKTLIDDYGVEAETLGFPPMPYLEFKYQDRKIRDAAIKTFYRNTVNGGILFHPYHHWFVSLSHTESDLYSTLNVVDISFKALRKSVL